MSRARMPIVKRAWSSVAFSLLTSLLLGGAAALKFSDPALLSVTGIGKGSAGYTALVSVVALLEAALCVLILFTRTRLAALGASVWLAVAFVAFALVAPLMGAFDCKCFGSLIHATRDSRLLFAGLLMTSSSLARNALLSDGASPNAQAPTQ
jgi:hypothetical protein